MKKTIVCILAALPLICAAQTGYRADVFVDGGIMLGNGYDYPAFRKMNLTVEKFIASDELTEIDTLLQKSMIEGNQWDENGILLYPDGAPRYRFIYMNRGKAGKHGESLENGGRTAIESFVMAGGGYVGTCAGAFLASRFLRTGGTIVPKSDEYLAIWPGTTESTNLANTYTGMVLPADSPLSKKEQAIDSIPHSGGCFAHEHTSWPPTTEVLARFSLEKDNSGKDLDGKPAVWAYRPSKSSGRIVLAGSPVEQCDTPEALWLMEGMIRYAIDANPAPAIKADLTLKDTRSMTYKSGHPDEARIGDGQFHHFTLEIPKGRTSATIVLSSFPGWKDFDLHIYVCKDKPANSSNASFKNESPGVDKELTLTNPEPGKYFISIFCATTPTTIETPRGTQYAGRTDALNGVPYTISFK